MKRSLSLLTAAILLGACQGGSSGLPDRSGAALATDAPGTPTLVPTQSPSAPVGAQIAVRLVGAEPVIHRADGPPNHDAVMPAAATMDADGSIVAFLVWLGPARGDHPVTVARSMDGRAWSIGRDAIYTDLGMIAMDPGPVPGAALRADDGTWLLYGWAASAAPSPSFFSWRATAPAAEGPWTVAPGDDRVLPPGPAGAWDDHTAAASAVLRQGSAYGMWYEGQRAGRTARGGVGYASSGDGISWSRFDDPSTVSAGDPVLGPGACGSASAAAALGPQVWPRGDGYLMLFLGSAGPDDKGGVLGAVSADGLDWTCTGEVLLAAGDIPGSQGIETIQGATIGGEPVLLIESLTDGGSDIWLATVSVSP